MTREELEKKAAELNVSFNANCKDETLAKKIEDAEFDLLEKETAPDLLSESDSGEIKSFVTCHRADFKAGGIDFKTGVAVELTKEQQDIPAIKNSIGVMLKEI